MAHKILTKFTPYTWYDISRYPVYERLSAYEGDPRVDLLVKYYDSKTDTFKFYKIRDTYYGGHNYGGQEQTWYTPPGHRAIGFLHDGEDLPLPDHKNGTLE